MTILKEGAKWFWKGEQAFEACSAVADTPVPLHRAFQRFHFPGTGILPSEYAIGAPEMFRKQANKFFMSKPNEFMKS